MISRSMPVSSSQRASNASRPLVEVTRVARHDGDFVGFHYLVRGEEATVVRERTMTSARVKASSFFICLTILSEFAM
jgi:hypothetical protein